MILDDTTDPVLKDITIVEDGQTLTVGDTAHFTVKVEDDSEITSVTAFFWAGNTTTGLSFEYNESTGLWEASYTITTNNIDGTYKISSIWAYDQYGNQGYVNSPSGSFYLEKNGHNIVVDSAVSATCTSSGLTEGSYCSICNIVLVEQEEVEKLAHTAASSWTTTKAATCGATGTKVKYCTVCNAVVESATIAKITSHSYGSYTTTKTATALATGTKTRTCSVCGTKDTATIAKLTPTITVNATTITLKYKQSTTDLVVSGLASGDYVKSYKSSNTKIFTVNSKGKITAKSKTGSAKLTITLASGKTKKITIKVQKSTVKTTKITLSKTKVSIKKGKTYKLSNLVTLTPFTSGQKLTYSSSNKKIATVSSTGKVTAKKKGTCYITIKSGSKSKKVKITVK